jgi:hypothetical protein
MVKAGTRNSISMCKLDNRFFGMPPFMWGNFEMALREIDYDKAILMHLV